MKFTAYERKLQGTGASRRLRNAAKVPGIVYGAGTPYVVGTTDYSEIRFPAFPSFNVQMPKNTIWRRDLTNCSKLLLDGAAKAIGLDDRYVTRAVMTKSLGPERTEMTIRFVQRV